MTNATANIHASTDADGITTLTWNMPGRTMNVLSADSIAEFEAAVHKAVADPAVKGVVVTSGKPAFIAGADLSMMEGDSANAGATTKDQALKTSYDAMMRLNRMMRLMETGKKPFVAAINGTAMGGGLEVCLACHCRIAADDPSIQLGLPESKVGLMPGAGGTQRMPRLIGMQAALPLILEGKSLDPQQALKAGLINKVVPRADLHAEAKAYIKNGGKAVQPWDEKDFRIPGGGVQATGGKQLFGVGNAMIHAKTYKNYPAQLAILSAVYEGMQVPIDAALRIEARYMAKVMSDPASRNMIRTLFINMQKASKGAARPKDIAPAKLETIAVLGAGMMGAGIAYVSAAAGLKVILIDQSQDAADRGKSYTAKLNAKAIARGRLTDAQASAMLTIITPTTSYDALTSVDMVIEAVFEDRAIKADVTKQCAAMLPPHAIFASNTSTLPITGLAEAWVAAGRSADTFIGVHFFSPVDRMQLVEIIMGKETGKQALAAAMDYVRRIKKTPIVVNDSRGFYTSRVFGTYTREGMEMLVEGINPALIENAGKMTGMPMPPLALTDEVALDLVYKVGKQTAKDLGAAYKPSRIDPLIEKMVLDLGRVGKKARKGFYDWPEDPKGQKSLWPGLDGLVTRLPEEQQPHWEILKERFLYRQALEAARCFEENVVTDPADADVGAILGWGFAPWTGGPLSLIDTVGAAAFVRKCDQMAQRYGERFAPNKLLREMATSGDTFYGRAKTKSAA
jgi:3-hydroxyacyl-CoA dehydrogenase / enoyl-CoA hydratase / 3-hydroxybutyryl-CoA epimerase